MSETIFFDNNNVKVTNTRFIVGNQTYAMAAVSSVKVKKTDITSSNAIPIIMIIIGGIWGFLAIKSFKTPSDITWPLIILASGCLWLYSIKKTFEYKIILTTSSGETSALVSTSSQDILPVEKALNDAIVFRG